jgi:hypothetical protein
MVWRAAIGREECAESEEHGGWEAKVAPEGAEPVENVSAQLVEEAEADGFAVRVEAA